MLMATKEEVKIDTSNKVQKVQTAAQIGSLVLTGVLTSLQTFFTK